MTGQVLCGRENFGRAVERGKFDIDIGIDYFGLAGEAIVFAQEGFGLVELVEGFAAALYLFRRCTRGSGRCYRRKSARRRLIRRRNQRACACSQRQSCGHRNRPGRCRRQSGAAPCVYRFPTPGGSLVCRRRRRAIDRPFFPACAGCGSRIGPCIRQSDFCRGSGSETARRRAGRCRPKCPRVGLSASDNLRDQFWPWPIHRFVLPLIPVIILWPIRHRPARLCHSHRPPYLRRIRG